MNPSQEEPLLIGYAGVETLLITLKQLSNKSPERNTLGFNVRITVDSVVASSSTIPIQVDITLTEKDTQGDGNSDRVFARLEVLHTFHVSGIEQLMKGAKYHVPTDLIEILLETAYNTTRGMLLVRGAGTIIETLILPMMDGEDIMQRFAKVVEDGNMILDAEEETG